MTFLKNTFHLYKEDWKRVFKSPMAIIVVLALMILPSFYAWFNIEALWDPYSNTSSLPVAVYSGDKTAKEQVLGKKISINIGDEVVDNLKKNHDIGWKFVDSKKDLEEGVKSGKYFAGIYLPKDFSTNLLSIITGETRKPVIEYYVNQKINAIAPKITDKGASAVQEKITKEFIGTVSKTLFTAMNQLGINLDDNLVDITKVKNILLNTDENLPEIEGYLNQVIDLNNKMPEIQSKVDKVNQIANESTPKINELADKVVAIDEKLPSLTKKLSPILTLQEKIPEIQNAGKQVAMIDNDFGQIEEVMQNAINDSKKGLEVIEQAQAVLPKVQETVNQANDLINTTRDGATKLQNGLNQVADTVSSSLVLVQTIANDTVVAMNNLLAFVNNNELTDQDKANIAKLASNISTNIDNLINLNQNIVEMLSKLQQASGNNKLDNLINTLNQINTVASNIKDHTNKLANSVQQMSTDNIKNILNSIKNLATNFVNLTNSLDINSMQATINDIISKLQNTLNNAQNVISEAQKIDVNGLLTNTKKTVAQALALLEKYQKELPALKQEIHDANTLLNGNMNTIIDGINKGAAFYQEGLPLIQQKLNKTKDFIVNDLPVIEAKMQNTLALVNAKLPVAKSALATTTDIINNDWPGIKAGIQKVAAQIREGEDKVNMSELIKLLRGNIKKETNFMTSPVKLKQHDYYPIPTYGAASTPFYTVLCLWVGGLLMASLLSTEVYIPKEEKQRRKEYTTREKFVSKLYTFLTIGLIQAVIVVLGNLFILDVYTKDKLYSMLFALLVSVSFTLCIYTLVGLFKDPGKAMAVIILVLSVAGGGGNFPIQLSGKFFQFINPLLPATYGYNLMREATGGIYWPNARFYIMMLILFGVVSITIGIFISPYVEKFMHKISESIEESHFFN